MCAMTDKEITNYKRRLYYAANKETCLKAIHKWEANNKGWRKEYYQKNKERIKAAVRAWQAANPERFKAIQRKAYLKRKARLAAHA
jgi:hypothetical protein